MSALTNFSVTTAAAVRVVNASSGNTFAKVSALGTEVYLGADNTVTVATGVPLPKAGETFQFTAAAEVWAIAKDATEWQQKHANGLH